MIKKLINGKINSITSAALILALATLASKFLGIIRSRILAGEFGAGNELDIYYAAFRIPDFIFNIVVMGALSAGFIPVFTRLISDKKEKEAFKTTNIILNLLFVMVIFLCLISIIFAPQLIDLVAPGFHDEKKEMTVELTRIMFLSPVFLLLSSILGGILQSYGRFFIYSLSPIMYNIGIIIGAVYFSKLWGLPGLAWGVALGSFLHFAIQLPIVFKLGFSYQWIIDIKDIGTKQIIRMMVPRTLTLTTSQLNLLVITAIASTLTAGSLAVFNLANDLQSFPLGLFAISFAVASFPTLSSLGAIEHRNEFARNLSKTTRQILFFVIPISVLFVALRAQIVRVTLGTGQFGWEDTVLTLEALGIFSISLFAQSVIPLFSRAFWALHDAKTPFFTSLVGVIVNLILAFYLSNLYGIIGLVSSFSIASIINAALLYYLINKKTNFVCHSRIYKPLLKISLAAVIAGYFSHEILYIVEPYLNTSKTIGIMTQGFISGLSGLSLYCFISWKLGVEELLIFKNAIKRRIFRSKIQTSEIISEE
jgi:putative peptidoglycan lipid II flippase